LSSTEDFVPELIHPAELSYVTLADCKKLVRNLAQLRRQALAAREDMTRVIGYNKKILYLLDFSEIHAFLWPSESQSQYQNLLNHLFLHSGLQFVLPPGAAKELSRKLENDAARYSMQRNDVTSWLDKPMVQQFIKVAKTGGNGIPSEELSRKLIEHLLELRSANEGLERLARLYDAGRLVHLSSVVDVEGLEPDREVFADGHSQLAASRLGKDDIVNLIDAHNYALTYALNNRHYDSDDMFFLLVTSSPRPFQIFEDITWKQDPLFNDGAEAMAVRTSLVRHPSQLLFHSYLNTIMDYPDAQLVISDAVNAISELHDAWKNISIFRQYVSKRNIQGTTRVPVPGGDRYRLCVKHFNDVYSQIYRPSLELLSADFAIDQNQRLLRGVAARDLAMEFDSTEDNSNEFIPPSLRASVPDYREVLALFDRVINLSLGYRSHQISSLSRYSLESVGDLGVSPDVRETSLTVSSRYHSCPK